MARRWCRLNAATVSTIGQGGDELPPYPASSTLTMGLVRSVRVVEVIEHIRHFEAQPGEQEGQRWHARRLIEERLKHENHDHRGHRARSRRMRCLRRAGYPDIGRAASAQAGGLHEHRDCDVLLRRVRTSPLLNLAHTVRLRRRGLSSAVVRRRQRAQAKSAVTMKVLCNCATARNSARALLALRNQ